MPDANREWSHRCKVLFWHPQAPADVKFEIEVASGRLLEREQTQTSRLVFQNSSSAPPNSYHLELRLEAALPQRNLYSLRLDATAPREWATEEATRRDTERAFAYWTRQLKATTNDPGPLDSASNEQYQRLVQATLDREAELASLKEDPAPIHAVQQAILDALKHGKSFRSSSKEGVSATYFNGRVYVQEESGMEPSRRTIETDEEMLDMLRKYFDYDASAATRPHKPPELYVWKYIQEQVCV